MPKKLTETDRSDTEFRPDDPELVERVKLDPDQMFNVYRIEYMTGKRRPVFIDCVMGWDINWLRDFAGGGTYQIRPVDSRGRFIPGGFTESIAGAPIPVNKIKYKRGVEGNDTVDDFEESVPIDSADRMERYLLNRIRELETKLEKIQIPEIKPGKIPGDYGKMMDEIIMRTAAYQAMIPFFEQLKGGGSPGYTEQIDFMRSMVDMIKEGIRLGQGYEPSDTAESPGILKYVDKFLPGLLEKVVKHEKTASVDKVIVPAVSKVIADNQQEGNVMLGIEGRLEKAITILIECLKSDADMTPDEIVREYVGQIVTKADIKLVGPNLTLENLLGVVSDHGDFEGKLVLRENADTVIEVLRILKGEPGKESGDSASESDVKDG